MTNLDLHNAAIARLEAELAASEVRARQKAQSYAELERMYQAAIEDATKLRKVLRDLWRVGRIWWPEGLQIDIETLDRLVSGPAQPTTTTPAEDERETRTDDL